MGFLPTRHEGVSVDEVERIYRDRYGEFLRLAMAVVGEREVALDVVHDAFVAVLRHRGSYRGEGDLGAWVWKVVLNKARDSAKAVKVVPLSDRLQAGEMPSRVAGVDVRRAVARLPERQRHALFLRYFGDLEYDTIAQVLEIKPGTVAATLSAARASLRIALNSSIEEAMNA